MKLLKPALTLTALASAMLVAVQPAQASVDDEFACQVNGLQVSCDVLVESSDQIWTMSGRDVSDSNGYGYLKPTSCGSYGDPWTVSVTFSDSWGDPAETHTHSGTCH